MRLQVGEGEGHYEDIEGVEPPTDDLVATTSFQEPIVSIGTPYPTPSTGIYNSIANHWHSRRLLL